MTPEKLWQDMLDSGPLLNGNAITYGSTTDWTPNLHEIKAMMDRCRVQMDETQCRIWAGIESMEPCEVCGHKAKYIKPPQERIQLCVCRVAALKRQCEPAPRYLPEHIGFGRTLLGIEIETVQP